MQNVANENIAKIKCVWSQNQEIKLGDILSLY